MANWISKTFGAVVNPIKMLADPINTIVGGVADSLKSNRALKKAIADNKIKLAQSAQSHNQGWEMRQLDNVGWKDEVLFYSFILMFVWAGFFPEKAGEFFTNLEAIPEYMQKIFMWIVASVVGVKKIGDYVPGAISGITNAIKKVKD